MCKYFIYLSQKINVDFINFGERWPCYKNFPFLSSVRIYRMIDATGILLVSNNKTFYIARIVTWSPQWDNWKCNRKQSYWHRLLGPQRKCMTLPKVGQLLKKQLFLNIFKFFLGMITMHITVLIAAVKLWQRLLQPDLLMNNCIT